MEVYREELEKVEYQKVFLLGLWALDFSIRVKRHYFYRRRAVKVDLNKAFMDNKNTIIGPNTIYNKVCITIIQRLSFIDVNSYVR